MKKKAQNKTSNSSLRKQALLIIFHITLLIGLFGFLWPYLFSAQNDELVVIGYMTVIGYVVYILPYIFKTIKKLKMKKLFLFMLVCMTALSFSSCNKVPAGNVGIKFYLLGQEKGVDYETLSPGRYYIGVNEELYLFPTQRQNKVWTNDITEDSEAEEGFEFQSKEGMKLEANIGIEYQINSENVPLVFEMYKKGCAEITNVVLRNAVRDALNTAASTRTAEQMYGPGKVEFMQEVKTIVTQKSKEKYITVNDIYLLGNMGIPSSVTEALNKKIEASQRAEQRENELREAEAQAKKDIAKAKGEAEAIMTRAKGEAEANRVLSASITPTLVEYKKIERWNGELPTVSGSASIVNLK
ncbi:MAG: SPFH domain-containing protein [Bacteroidales bacterium]